MIRVDNCSKRYGTTYVLEGLSFDVEKGSIYGLVGNNGAGKTTLLKMIAGIMKTDSGQIVLDDENIYENVKKKSQLFFIPDDLYFLSQSSLNSMARFYRGFYPNWSDTVYKSLISLFQLNPKKNLNTFSKGMQRQAEIILALSTQPEYLLLDETFDGLDPVHRNLFRKLLLELIAEKNVTIIISSHNLRELEDLTDHIGLLHNKKVIYNCSIDELRSTQNHFKLIFTQEISADLLNGIAYSQLKIEGKIVTFVGNGKKDAITEQLNKLDPVIIESYPLTLEEIFLNEMEAIEYDFTEIIA